MTDLQVGLSEAEARRRLEAGGKNVLAGQKKRSLLRLFFTQFQDAMILILLAAAGLSLLLGDRAEMWTVLAMVLLNALMGFFQEARTEQAMEELKKLSAPSATVLRAGKKRALDPEFLVPGDLLLLEAGDRIGADGVLLAASGVEADESLLTGESRGVAKCALPKGAPIPENRVGCPNRVCMGTLLVAGHGICQVTEVGMATQMGQIAHLLASVEEEKTPLQKKLNRLGRQLGILCLAVCALVALFGLLRGEKPLDMLVTAVSLAVAAVPEGLPAVVTLSLAMATNRLLKQKALLRRLHLAETLGSATVICSDKTGTLTQGKMELQTLLTASACLTQKQTDPSSLYPCLALCNRLRWAETNGAGMTDRALKEAADRLHLFFPDARLLGEVPFDPRRKRMSVSVRCSGKTLLLTKGAPELVLPLCSSVRMDDGIRKLEEPLRQRLQKEAKALGQKGLRVLALAERESASLREQELTFLGFAGLADPPRKETRAAVLACRRAGIRPVMITGDAAETALAVGRAIGLAQKGIVTEGSALDCMDERTLQQTVQKTEIFARVTPAHKLNIVAALKRNGETVAMTGDGVNDAPAVKEADIGIAMGSCGTDVTREAAGMVLLDDSFSSIVAAVKEGRAIFDNIRRFIRYLLACNLGEVLCMFLAMVFGMPTLLLPIQILLVNFVTDGLPALALGAEPPEKGIMEQPPKSSQSLFGGGLIFRILCRGALIGLSTLCGFLAVFSLTNGSVESARTGALFVLIFAQLIHALECKSETKGLFSIPLLSNKKLLLALLFSALCLFSVLYCPPLAALFAVVPLSPACLAACLGISLAVPAFAALLALLPHKK